MPEVDCLLTPVQPSAFVCRMPSDASATGEIESVKLGNSICVRGRLDGVAWKKRTQMRYTFANRYFFDDLGICMSRSYGRCR